MPELSELEATEVTMPVNVFGKPIVVTYRPMAILGDSAAYSAAAVTESPDVLKKFIETFVRVVVAWDITETKGRREVPVPITYKRLSSQFPMQIIMTIMEAVIYDRDTRNLPSAHPLQRMQDMARMMQEAEQMDDVPVEGEEG